MYMVYTTNIMYMVYIRTTHDLRPISAKGGTILLPITMQLKAAWQDRIPDPTEITRR